MLLTKLRTFVAVAVVAFLGAGVVGLSYRTTAAEPRQPAAPGAAQPAADDLEALRLEVEALRKSLQATRQEMRSLAAEVRALKGEAGAEPRQKAPGADAKAPPAQPADPKVTEGLINLFRVERAPDKPAAAGDPLAEAEAALKKLRQDPGDKEAADALEKALQQLKERAKQEGALGYPAKRP